MNEPAAPPVDWRTRARRWSAPRLAAAALLHVLVLVALLVGTGRVQLPRPGADRVTMLVNVLLAPPRAPRTAPVTPLRRAVRGAGPATTRPPREMHPAPIALPIHLPPAVAPAVAIAAKPPVPPSSAPLRDLLDSAAARAAVREVARATPLSHLADAATHEDQGSTMVDVDGSACDCVRNLAPSKSASERLARATAAAGRPDCLRMSSAAGLLALPVLALAEAAGKCSN